MSARTSRFCLLLVIAAAIFGNASGTAGAANGDFVGEVQFSQPCPSGLGVGIAYDFQYLWYSCRGSVPDLYRADPATGQVNATYNIAGGLGALSYDRFRKAIWAGWDSSAHVGQVRLIQLGIGKNVVSTTLKFNTGSHAIACALDDGLAYDHEDDTLYISDDCSTTIHRYDANGNHLADGPNGTGDFAWKGTSCYNSGLAIGGDLLYEGSNGCRHVWVVDKNSPSSLAFDFATPGIRDEDLECDTGTFADQGKHVMWSKDAYTPYAYAFEIPFRSCGTGGEAPRRLTSTTYTGDASVQYSDAATLSGTLLDITDPPSVGVPDKQLDFTLGTQKTSAGPTDSNGNVATTLVVNQLPGSVSTVDTSFTNKDLEYKPSSDSDPFAVLKEDCTLTYSGDTIVQPNTSTNLAADMSELDASLGDRSNKAITFTATDAVGNSQSYSANTDANGHAAALVQLQPGVYSVMASFAGDGYYKSCVTAADAVVSVASVDATVTGGGWIWASGRVSIGFNVISKTGDDPKGQLQLRTRILRKSFHSGVVLGVGGFGDVVTWAGTGDWAGQPGYLYLITVEDNGSPGSAPADTVNVDIAAPNGTPVFSTNGPRPLRGGNVTVHK
jgi:hypothetical protein